MENKIDVTQQLDNIAHNSHINALNFNLDNAIDSFLLFYTGYIDNETNKESNTGYCDTLALDVINVIVGEYSEYKENSEIIRTLVMSFFDLYKKEIRKIVKEKMISLKNIIDSGNKVDDNSLKQTSQMIIDEASNYYHESIKELFNEVNGINNNHQEEIRNYFYGDVFNKLIVKLEDNLNCYIGITKNSFKKSDEQLQVAINTNAEIVANTEITK